MPRVVTHIDLASVLDGFTVTADVDEVDRAVLDAVLDLLATDGLGGIEVDRVAERAGIGRSTLYRRFTGRNELLSAGLAHACRQFLEELADHVADIDDVAERVLVGFAHGLDLAEERGLGELVRTEPLMLRMLTVDAAPLLAVASEQLLVQARRIDSGVDAGWARATAEVLVRLAVSFLVTPTSALDLTGPERHVTIRRHLAPLLTRLG